MPLSLLSVIKYLCVSVATENDVVQAFEEEVIREEEHQATVRRSERLKDKANSAQAEEAYDIDSGIY